MAPRWITRSSRDAVRLRASPTHIRMTATFLILAPRDHSNAEPHRISEQVLKMRDELWHIKSRLSHRLCLAFPVSFFYLFFIIFSIQANDAAALLNSFMPLREHHRNDPFDDPSMSAAHLFYKSILHSAESFLGHPRKILLSYFLLAVSFVAIRIVPKYHLHLSLCM